MTQYSYSSILVLISGIKLQIVWINYACNAENLIGARRRTFYSTIKSPQNLAKNASRFHLPKDAPTVASKTASPIATSTTTTPETATSARKVSSPFIPPQIHSLFIATTAFGGIAGTLQPTAEDSTNRATREVIPDSIADIPDSFLQDTFSCQSCSRSYRIIKLELALYRKMNVPLPRRCGNCRRLERFEREPGFGHLYPRTCELCAESVLSIYADPLEKVLCEKCYLRTIL